MSKLNYKIKVIKGYLELAENERNVLNSKDNALVGENYDGINYLSGQIWAFKQTLLILKGC